MESKIRPEECLRCGGVMTALGVQKLQLGQAGFFMGNLGNILSGALEVSIYSCNKCGHIDFYNAEVLRKT